MPADTDRTPAPTPPDWIGDEQFRRRVANIVYDIGTEVTLTLQVVPGSELDRRDADRYNGKDAVITDVFYDGAGIIDDDPELTILYDVHLTADDTTFQARHNDLTPKNL